MGAREKTLTARITGRERGALERLARERGKSLSELARDVLLEEIRETDEWDAAAAYDSSDELEEAVEAVRYLVHTGNLPLHVETMALDLVEALESLKLEIDDSSP